MLLGDAVYADQAVFLKLRLPADAARLASSYAAQKADPSFAAFTAAVPLYAVIDDHDYGANDGDKTFALQRESNRLFLDFLDEPAESPRRAQSDGVYGVWFLGPPGRRVRLILLDNRSSKDPYPKSEEEAAQDMLGETQWAWLEGVLRNTTADVTLLGTGLQVLSRGSPWVGESWSRMPASQAKLLALLVDTGAVGSTVLLSGDVHFGELNQWRCGGGGDVPPRWVFTEGTSSGLTHSWDGFIKTTLANICMVGASRMPGASSILTTRNWGEVRVEWPDETEEEEGSGPRVRLRVYSVDDGQPHLEAWAALAPAAAALAAAQEAEHWNPPVPRHYAERRARLPSGGWLAPGDEAIPLWQAVHDCARQPASSGLSAACRRFVASCDPPLTTGYYAVMVGGHALVIGGAGAGLVGLLGAPVGLWCCRRRVPGGRAGLRVAFACLTVLYAIAWRLLDSVQ